MGTQSQIKNQIFERIRSPASRPREGILPAGEHPLGAEDPLLGSQLQAAFPGHRLLHRKFQDVMAHSRGPGTVLLIPAPGGHHHGKGGRTVVPAAHGQPGHGLPGLLHRDLRQQDIVSASGAFVPVGGKAFDLPAFIHGSLICLTGSQQLLSARGDHSDGRSGYRHAQQALTVFLHCPGGEFLSIAVRVTLFQHSLQQQVVTAHQHRHKALLLTPAAGFPIGFHNIAVLICRTNQLAGAGEILLHLPDQFQLFRVNFLDIPCVHRQPPVSDQKFCVPV